MRPRVEDRNLNSRLRRQQMKTHAPVNQGTESNTNIDPVKNNVLTDAMVCQAAIKTLQSPEGGGEAAPLQRRGRTRQHHPNGERAWKTASHKRQMETRERTKRDSSLSFHQLSLCPDFPRLDFLCPAPRTARSKWLNRQNTPGGKHRCVIDSPLGRNLSFTFGRVLLSLLCFVGGGALSLQLWSCAEWCCFPLPWEWCCFSTLKCVFLHVNRSSTCF